MRKRLTRNPLAMNHRHLSTLSILFLTGRLRSRRKTLSLSPPPSLRSDDHSHSWIHGEEFRHADVDAPVHCGRDFQPAKHPKRAAEEFCDICGLQISGY
ncbi:hypothetical protein AVEN_249397-1 [Araneus ventricosus]|uniref:Uncharacterized protein n=1 Tax=Araneus ventricosus TaxID=182803 RepID=A0A4Y2IB73_ARAVE|nr:hypothetical protein AVEN_249397-1 [Araneus ventricosus]